MLIAVRLKKPAAGFRRGLNSCDDERMPVICPTVQEVFSGADRNPKAPTEDVAAGFIRCLRRRAPSAGNSQPMLAFSLRRTGSERPEFS
jgi:hypothetical protein